MSYRLYDLNFSPALHTLRPQFFSSHDLWKMATKSDLDTEFAFNTCIRQQEAMCVR